MAEHLSGYRPEPSPGEGLPTSSTDSGDIESSYDLLAPEELDQMREAAAVIEAAIQEGGNSLPSPPPDGAIPVSFVQAERDEDLGPVWGVEPLDEPFFPEEAPTQQQREHARSYYFTLVALAERRYRAEETVPEPGEIAEAYLTYRELFEQENQAIAPAERLPHFTLPQLTAAARRQNL